MLPWEALRRRHDLLRRLRTFFDDRGYLEVVTPRLSSETMIDPHIEPWQVPDPRPASRHPFYLQTSPELHMKRLLCAGSGSIFQVGSAFRVGERGPWHNPEFTLAEWYGVGDDMAAGIRLLGDLVSVLLGCEPPEAISYRDCFARSVRLDPLTCSDARLAAVAERWGAIPQTASRDDLLDWLLATAIQPKLGGNRPAIIHGFPASQAALARLDPDRPEIALRFEMFYRGVELANGYDELTDVEELKGRLLQNQQYRAELRRAALPLPERFLAAMGDGLPACTGVALGFDRVVLLSLAGQDLGHVCPFPLETA